MQVNSTNLSLLGLGLTEAFDACHNITGATRLIRLFSQYNTGSPVRGITNGYAGSVMQKVETIKARGPVITPSPAPAPPNPFTGPGRTSREVSYQVERK
jgi:type IV secretion system protein VirB1